MSSIHEQRQQPDNTPVHPYDLHTQTKRDVAIFRAAQQMADAFRCWMGIRPCLLNEMDPDTKAFYWQTARNTIDQYLSIVQEQEPVTRGDLRVIDGGKDRL